MKRTVGRILSNPAVQKAAITVVSDIVYLYAKAFINVVTRKIENVGDNRKSSPQVVEVTLED